MLFCNKFCVIPTLSVQDPAGLKSMQDPTGMQNPTVGLRTLHTTQLFVLLYTSLSSIKIIVEVWVA